jgi:hypothetical protein
MSIHANLEKHTSRLQKFPFWSGWISIHHHHRRPDLLVVVVSTPVSLSGWSCISILRLRVDDLPGASTSACKVLLGGLTTIACFMFLHVRFLRYLCLEVTHLMSSLLAWAENKRLKVRLTDLLRKKNTVDWLKISGWKLKWTARLHGSPLLPSVWVPTTERQSYFTKTKQWRRE